MLTANPARQDIILSRLIFRNPFPETTMRVTLSQKLFGMAALLLLFTCIVSVFSILASHALHDRDDARLVEISFLQARQGDLDFSTFKGIKFANRVDTAVAVCDSILHLYATEQIPQNLNLAIKQYHTRFDSIVTDAKRLGPADTLGVAGTLNKTLRTIETFMPVEHQEDTRLLFLLARSKVREVTDVHIALGSTKTTDELQKIIATLRIKSASVNISPADQTTADQAFSSCSEQIRELGMLKKRLQALSNGLKTDIVAIRPLLKELANQKARRADIITASSLAAIGLSFVLSVIIGIVLSRSITKPVAKLREAVQTVAAGNIDTTVEVTSNDEIGDVAQAFNQMIRSIKSGITELQAEKASVQAKVEEAVSESEREKRYLARSVERMLVGVNNVAQGDLTVRLIAAQDDDIARLYEGLNNALENIAEMVHAVSQAVEATAAAGGDISLKTSQMASNMERQTAQTDDVAQAISAINLAITQNTQQTSLASSEAAQASADAVEGGKIISRTIDGMGSIADVVIKSAQTIEQLGKSSEEIGEIIQVIEEIADQTNLLALNAAIEAARAGEQGRGFAVVADEVRKLAERTQKATRQIGSMIQQIQTNTINAINAMQEGTQEVAKGKAMTEQAAGALERIIERTSKVSGIITLVAEASQKQAVASKNITQSIESISTVTQSSSDAIHQIEHTASNLQRLTNNLQLLVSRFIVTNEHHHEKHHTAQYVINGHTQTPERLLQ